ncbi:3-oxo-5-alpha-steroid 4-dehydrogenase 1 [Mactra antiquata]
MLSNFDKMFKTLVDLIRNKEMEVLYAISCIYFVTAILVLFILLSGITAPYGRYTRGGWGVHVNGKFAWFVQELPSFLVPVTFLIFDKDAPRFNLMPNMFLFGLFSIHYFQRACIFPFLIKGGKPTPFVTFMLALIFCFVNGYLQCSYLFYHGDYGTEWWLRPHIWIGTVIFFVGMTINIHSDHVLRNLRKPGETGYKIPRDQSVVGLSQATDGDSLCEKVDHCSLRMGD